MLPTLADAAVATSGGKAAGLGALVRAGLPVPPGVVVPAAVHRAATDGLGLADLAARRGAAAARARVRDRPLPAGLRADLAASLAALEGGPVAVRSSAAGEDTAADSGAGQHDTVLGAVGVDAVADAVRVCWSSLWSDRAVAYRQARGAVDEPATGVVVQRHVDADVAGVLFAGAPHGPASATRLEASWGLGASVVGGRVTPDAWSVTPHGVVDRVIGDKATRVDRVPGGVAVRDVPAPHRHRACLTDEDVLRVVALGRAVAEVVGAAVDVEWALEGDRLWVLQARPVTAELPPRAPTAAPRPGGTLTSLAGTPGSAGTATGPVRLVHGPADFAAVGPGDVLVCRFTDPAWTPLFGIVAGVVTETGGALSHAAIVAREHRIPAVLGVAGVMGALADGEPVTVDAAAGAVHRLGVPPAGHGLYR